MPCPCDNGRLVSDFPKAISILNPLYDAASVHVVYENDQQIGQRNLYATVAYGRAADMRSVPTTLELQAYGRFTVARKRVDRAMAAAFIQGATVGLATLNGYEVAFELGNEIVEGFRPAGSFSTMIQKSPFNTSLWTRERIGVGKRVGARLLEKSAIWDLAADLAFLNEARWSAIPLLGRLEKLGDLDEWWPSPVEIESRNPKGTLQVEVSRNIVPSTRHATLSVRGTALADGLEVADVSLSGPGPYAPLPTNADGSELTVYVDGIAMHRTAGHYVRTIGMRLGMMTQEIWTVKPAKGRPGMAFPVGSAHHQESYAGALPRASTRREAWAIGDYSRSHGILDDAERVYDPGARRDTVKAAFDDLRSLGVDQFQPRIRVADPYGLDEAAMEAIAVSALRDGRPQSIELYCEFKPPPNDEAATPAATATTTGATPPTPTLTKKQREEAAAKSVADRIKARLGVRVVCYRVQGLHDRFLIIGERLWHVGPSLNKVGEEFSALVEIRDPRRVADVVAYLDRHANTANEVFRT
ncbi:MAG: hypothetical protein JWP44_4481 [Mucilaginibacter sp.]|nr:hypothetical protein [Mucilaginibacter sp.]